MEPKLFTVLVKGANNKERTAKVYAATLRRIHKAVYKKPIDDPKLPFLRTTKMLNYVKKIVNLTRRKNAATAAVQGLKATKGPEATITKFREIMMQADKDYTKFLVSGQRKRPFENAEAAWKLVTGLHKVVAKEIEGRRLWELGEHVSHKEYRVLMAWIYLKWLSSGLAPRRLEYAESQFISKKDYDAAEKNGNYVVMGKRRYTWALHNFKTVGKYGPQIFVVPGPLKAALNKIKRISLAKSDKGYIFLNNKFKPLSRSQFSSFVKWVFAAYAGKKWTQNTVRSIKVSSVWSPGKENPVQLARDMGHDLKTAIVHYKQ